MHRIAGLALAVGIAPALGAQPGAALARRVAAAPDGDVRLTYATRPEVCGDGRDGVSFGRSFYLSARIESYGGWSEARCERGPARVTLTLRGHEVVGVETRVGGTWAAAAGAHDLGAVSAVEAASYFISLVPTADHGSRGGPLLAAAVADSANVAPEMLRLGRTATLARETRRRAIHWSGVLGDSSMVAPLVELARSSGAAETDAKQLGPGRGLEGAATGALAAIPDGAGIPALMQLARDGSLAVRKSAVFWLGENDDPRGRALVRSIDADEREDDDERSSAKVAYGQGGASDDDLVALYRGATPRGLREHMIFVLSQRREDAATTALIAIVREDADREMRKKALFWLAQRDDPRVTKLLTDLVLK
jgi:HEAT repeat protein